MTQGSLSAESVAGLRGAVRGPVLTAGEPGYDRPSAAWLGMSVPSYDAVRAAWNGLFDRRPDVIVQCMGVADVKAAVAFARAHDLAVAVRGGGHSSSGASTIDGGMLIDLSLLRGVRVDPERRTAVAGGGTLLGELDRECQSYGLGCTAGTVSHTGIAGLTLGGGIGRMMRKHGLTCDNVSSFDVVTADGEALHVDADHHPDLFWALRGGGGGQCVVTHFEYQLHPLGPLVYGGFLGWPIEQTMDVYTQVRDAVAGAPDELQVQFIFTTGPRADFMPPGLQGRQTLLMTATWVGQDLEEGERHIAPFRERVPAIMDAVGPYPYTMLQSVADALAPHGRFNCASMCGYLDDLTAEMMEVAIAQAEQFPTEMGFIEFSQMGGAVSRVPAEATAASEFRGAGFLYIVGANCLEQADVEACREWTFRADDAFEPFRRSGRYINFVSEDDEDTMRDALGHETWARLEGVKAKYDPDGVFSRNPNRVATA